MDLIQQSKSIFIRAIVITLHMGVFWTLVGEGGKIK